MGGCVAGRESCTEFRPEALCTRAFSLERHGLAGRSGLQSHSVPAASVRDGLAPSATAACLADGAAPAARRAGNGPIPNATAENRRAAMARDTRATSPWLGGSELPFEDWGTVRLSTTTPSPARASVPRSNVQRVSTTTPALAPRPTVWERATRAPATWRAPHSPRS